MGVRSQLSWLVKGRATTQSTLESLSVDLRSCSEGRRDRRSRRYASHRSPLLRDRQLDEFDKVRDAVAERHRRPDGQGRRAATADREVVTGADETPAERLARWTAADAAIGLAAEGEQLRVAARRAATREIADLRERVSRSSTNRVAQLEAENAELRRRASRVPRPASLRRAVPQGQSAAGRVVGPR